MRFIFFFDSDGLMKVDLVANQDEQQTAHETWQSIQSELQSLSDAISRCTRKREFTQKEVLIRL